MKKLLLLVFVLLVPAVVAAQLPTGTISGQVFLREGQPAVGVRVSAMTVAEPGTPASSATGMVGISMTDSAGRYRLEAIPPGRYYVVAGLVDLPTYYPGVSSMSGATALNVLSGTPITGINFTVAAPAGVKVSGRLVHPNGSPATEVRTVGLQGGQRGTISSSTVRSDGSFEFLRVSPGNYRLVLASAQVSRQQIPVTVAEKDVTGLQIEILPTVAVTGLVNVQGDGPRPQFQLIFSPFKGSGSVPGAALTNGTFQVGLLEGDYRIGWSNLPEGYELKSITAGSANLLSTALKVSMNAPLPPIVVTLGVGEKPPWVRVGGKVTGLPSRQSGTPFRLSLSSSVMADVSVLALINPDGSFEFAKLLPGSYFAEVTPALPVVPITFSVGARDVADLKIAIPPLKEIPGVISMPTASGVGIGLSWPDPSNGNTLTATATIQPDKTFKFLVPEGERRVTLTVPGFTVQSFMYGSMDLLKGPLKVSASDTAEFRATVTQTVPTAPGVSGGVVGGVLGGILTGAPFSPVSPLPPTVTPGATASTVPTRIGGDVAQANLISSVQPIYPEAARAAQVQGVVLLNAQISKEGVVEDLRVISGHPLLNDAAIQAVRQWRYRPYMLSGQPIPVVTTITVNFSMR